MKIEKLKAKLAKYEEAYRAARREYGTALAAEVTRMHASDLPEEKVRKIRSKGKGRGNDTLDLSPAAKARRKKGGPKAKSRASGASTNQKPLMATTSAGQSKRGPGRPRMTPAQKLAARAERQAKLMATGELGSMAAMDDQISQYDADAEMAARHAQ